MKRTEAPNATGRTPIFNFDEWNNEHYGKAFQRSQAARKRFNAKPETEIREANSVKYEVFILGGLAFTTLIMYIIMQIDSSRLDTVKNVSYESSKVD